jgi:hypothetical protein
MIIAAGADVNLANRFKNCACKNAAFKGHTGVVDALLEAGSTCDPATIEEALKFAAKQKIEDDSEDMSCDDDSEDMSCDDDMSDDMSKFK